MAEAERPRTDLHLHETERRGIVLQPAVAVTHTLRLVKARPVTIASIEAPRAFRPDGVVLHPRNPSALADDTALRLLAATIAHAGATQPAPTVLVAGHGATELASARAEGVAALLRGDRAAWGGHAAARAGVADLQAFLAWVEVQRGWGTDPGAVDGVTGPRTREALRRFRARWAEDGRDALPASSADATASDWSALHDLLRESILDLAGARARATPSTSTTNSPTSNPSSVGCGDAWTPERCRIDGFDPAQLERVDVLLFAPGDAPALRCHSTNAPCAPSACDLFRKRKYKATVLAPVGERRRQARVVLFEDVHFHHDSAVLLPDAKADGDAPPGPDRVTGLAVVQTVLEAFDRFPDDRLLIAGHTDTSGGADYNAILSRRRADGVHAVVRGDKAAFGAVCQAKHQVEDCQQLLAWVARTFAWDTDPGPVDGKAGDRSSAALRRFRARFSRERGASLPEHGPVRASDWEAFFVLFDEHLAARLETDAAGLAALRARARFVDPPAVGCGESHPIEAVGVDGFRSATNRRVELLLFRPEDLPRLACHAGGGCKPAACDLYRGGRYAPRYLPVGLELTPLELVVFTAFDSADDSALVIRDRDGGERLALAASAGLDDGGGHRRFTLDPRALPTPATFLWRAAGRRERRLGGPCDPRALRDALAAGDHARADDLLGAGVLDDEPLAPPPPPSPELEIEREFDGI